MRGTRNRGHRGNLLADCAEQRRIRDLHKLAGDGDLDNLLACNRTLIHNQTMNTAQLVESLTPEQHDALIALRAEIHDAQNRHDTELGEAHLAALAAKDVECENVKASRDKTIADLQAKVSERDEQIQRITTAADAAVTSAVAERDAQIARSQELAKRFKAARDKRKAADADYSAVDAEEDATIAEASQGLDEQAAAEKEAKRKALEAELAKLA